MTNANAADKFLIGEVKGNMRSARLSGYHAIGPA